MTARSLRCHLPSNFIRMGGRPREHPFEACPKPLSPEFSCTLASHPVDGGFLLFQCHVSRIAYFRPSGPQSGLRFGIPPVTFAHYCGFKGVVGREVRQKALVQDIHSAIANWDQTMAGIQQQMEGSAYA